MSIETPFPILSAIEAIAWFRQKGFTFGFSWADVWQEEHARAFTVAKAMRRDILEDIRAAVDRALTDGTTLAQFRKQLQPVLEEKGWWGRKRMIDPLTAEAKVVQLGSPRRLKTIFTTNLRTAYQAGRWERIDRQKAAFPILVYRSVLDGREREEHGAWHDTALPVDDDWWNTHYPPCDWECRCTALPMNARMMARQKLAITDEPVAFPARQWTNKRTGEVHSIERGIGPGWSYHVGKAPLAGHAPAPLPERFDGDDVAASNEVARILARFFDPFGIEADGIERGRVFVDAGGWELAMSLGWFQRQGVLAMPGAARRAALGEVGRTIADPDEIRWVWVAGANGRTMLMRRYLRLDAAGVAIAVDVGREGWRWRSRGELRDVDRLRAGVVSWSAETAAIAGYNPHQPRHGPGGRNGGQFRSTNGPRLRASLTGDRTVVPKASIGTVSSSTARLTAKIGIASQGLPISVSHGYAVKILNRHGAGREKRENHLPVSIGDIFRAPELLNTSIAVKPDTRGRRGRHGQPRFEAKTERGSAIYNMVFEVNPKRDVTLVAMFKWKR